MLPYALAYFIVSWQLGKSVHVYRCSVWFENEAIYYLYHTEDRHPLYLSFDDIHGEGRTYEVHKTLSCFHPCYRDYGILCDVPERATKRAPVRCPRGTNRPATQAHIVHDLGGTGCTVVHGQIPSIGDSQDRRLLSFSWAPWRASTRLIPSLLPTLNH